jgi:hypothetical protein
MLWRATQQQVQVSSAGKHVYTSTAGSRPAEYLASVAQPYLELPCGIIRGRFASAAAVISWRVPVPVRLHVHAMLGVVYLRTFLAACCGVFQQQVL